MSCSGNIQPPIAVVFMKLLKTLVRQNLLHNKNVPSRAQLHLSSFQPANKRNDKHRLVKEGNSSIPSEQAIALGRLP